MEGTIEENIERIEDGIADLKMIIKGGTCHGCTECPEVSRMISDLELLIKYIKEGEKDSEHF